MQTDTKMKQRFREKHFSPQEYGLIGRLPHVDRTDPDSLEWIALIGQLRRHLDKDPTAHEVQHVIRRLLDKVPETFGEEEVFIEKVWEIRKSPEKSQEMGFYPLDSEFLVFIEKAVDFYLSTENRYKGE